MVNWLISKIISGDKVPIAVLGVEIEKAAPPELLK